VEYTSEEVEGRVVGELLRARLAEFTGPGCGLLAIGPRAMMHSVYEMVGDRAPLQVSLEERMACGVGACRSCVVPIIGQDGPTYLTACREGPVFYAHQVDWGRLT
jgi:NAD(P)H-flavin reductase